MAAPKGNTYAKGNKGGVKTSFKPEFIDALIAFFDVKAYEIVVTESSVEYFTPKKEGEKRGPLKKKLEKTRAMPNKLPTLFGFSRSIGVRYMTVWRWAQKGKEALPVLIGDKNYTDMELKERRRLAKALQVFSDAYKEAKELQKEFLMNLGLAGVTPAGAYIFTAKNITDMRDDQKIDHTTKGDKIVGINYVVPAAPSRRTNNDTDD